MTTTPTAPPQPPNDEAQGTLTTGARPKRRRLKGMLIGLFFIALVGSIGAGFALGYIPKSIVSDFLDNLTPPTSSSAGHAESSPKAPEPIKPWDGLVTVEKTGRDGMGVATTKALPQTEPIRLELLGKTEYDSDTLSRIRFMFKGRVDHVYTTVGQTVKKGDPLIDLYSTELAEAKSAYEIKQIQWAYDKNLLDTREPLLKVNAISSQQYAETRNAEMKSRRDYEVARDKLMVYGLNEAEVNAIKDQNGAQKARMTLRSPADGIVITRDVVAGNLYDDDDTLLVLSPLDHLWVWGNVFESDLDMVKIGQTWNIEFPFLNHKLRGTVEYISNRVDPGTHAVRVRTSVPNPEGRLKSDMLVRGMLEIPPGPGRTVIPRTALVVADRHYYVFVQSSGSPDRFERRPVQVAQEKDDYALIDHGLNPGETVVSVGSLLLAQLYDDLRTVQTGAPPGGGPSVDEH
ncbi:efflux RND transporter periplasmic adaptor subunit [Singulisphaera sp. PoT]|uniref:efflux RND transporter periplasmic adaptor subunit n=1 Tax=Singulisphaera sp. PoT TaxID=3411797 RepID=UPI003BF5EB69